MAIVLGILSDWKQQLLLKEMQCWAEVPALQAVLVEQRLWNIWCAHQILLLSLGTRWAEEVCSHFSPRSLPSLWPLQRALIDKNAVLLLPAWQIFCVAACTVHICAVSRVWAELPMKEPQLSCVSSSEFSAGKSSFSQKIGGYWLLYSWKYGIVWLGKGLKNHFLPTPCHGQGCLPLDQAAQSFFPTCRIFYQWDYPIMPWPGEELFQWDWYYEQGAAGMGSETFKKGSSSPLTRFSDTSQMFSKLFLPSDINTYPSELAWRRNQGVVNEVWATWGHPSLI